MLLKKNSSPDISTRSRALEGKSIQVFLERLDALESKVNKASQRGRNQPSITSTLLRRVPQYGDAVLLFVRCLSVPFANNVAERAARMSKVK